MRAIDAVRRLLPAGLEHAPPSRGSVGLIKRLLNQIVRRIDLRHHEALPFCFVIVDFLTPLYEVHVCQLWPVEFAVVGHPRLVGEHVVSPFSLLDKLWALAHSPRLGREFLTAAAFLETAPEVTR